MSWLARNNGGAALVVPNQASRGSLRRCPVDRSTELGEFGSVEATKLFAVFVVRVSRVAYWRALP